MSYYPGTDPVLRMIGTYTPGVSRAAIAGLYSSPSSAAWESAARAVYYCLRVPSCVVRRVWWANGATTSGATVEVGLYADNGHRPGVNLVSGSAAQGTASTVQFVDVTDTGLAGGVVWIAMMMSSATNTTAFRSAAAATYVDVTYRLEQASANPLPSTATPVESSASSIWLCGFATTASP